MTVVQFRHICLKLAEVYPQTLFAQRRRKLGLNNQAVVPIRTALVHDDVREHSATAELLLHVKALTTASEPLDTILGTWGADPVVLAVDTTQVVGRQELLLQIKRQSMAESSFARLVFEQHSVL
ncbi:hypothetical protein [uncultured Microbacterium sp.]|uniref:hypothetical protein n=1 Tax=uncultured Microbacterium sp. TaxID=191216 RepID=UPI0028DC6433|nr:hypothetical protein [uncultured Microbacterium sp.]